MARLLPSHAEPAMLFWARETRKLSVEDVAEKLKILPALVAKWESGQETPSMAQLRRLGRLYRRPTMVFYLKAKPTEFTIVEDFRRLPDSKKQVSPALQKIILFAQERQAWASNYLEETGADKCGIVKSAKLSEGTKVVGQRLRKFLAIDLKTQLNWKGPHTAFLAWKNAVESLGVFVFHTEKISLSEMRGCALSDAYAPTVLLNSQDLYPARIFTLMHEMIHVLLGLSAISGGSQVSSGRTPPAQIERFCNAAAAEALVPADDFVKQIPRNWRDNDDAVISNAAKFYHVSRLVIVLRLVETRLADSAYLQKKWPMLQRKPKPRERKVGFIPPPPFRRALNRNGELFSRVAMAAFESGAIHGGEFFELTRLKLKDLSALEEALHPSRVYPVS